MPGRKGNVRRAIEQPDKARLGSPPPSPLSSSCCSPFPSSRCGCRRRHAEGLNRAQLLTPRQRPAARASARLPRWRRRLAAAVHDLRPPFQRHRAGLSGVRGQRRDRSAGFGGGVRRRPARSARRDRHRAHRAARALDGQHGGTAVSRSTTRSAPDRLKRLVLYGSTCTGNLPKHSETFEATIARLENLGVDARADFIVPTWFVAGEAAPYFAMSRDARGGLSTEATIRALQRSPSGTCAGGSGRFRYQRWSSSATAIGRPRPNSPIGCGRGYPTLVSASSPGCAPNVHLERPELFTGIVLHFLTAG